MTRGIYVLGAEPATGKSAIAIGVQRLLAGQVSRLGVFRPVARSEDPLLDVLCADGAASATGVSYADVRADERAALDEIVTRYRALAAACDAVLTVGTDFAGVGTAGELAFNARVALNLGLPVLRVGVGPRRGPEDIQSAVDVALTMMRRIGAEVVAVVANRVRAGDVDTIAAAVTADVPVYVVPEDELLMAPTMAEVMAACDGELLGGTPEALGREALTVLVAAMTVPNLIKRLTDGALLITPGDRVDVVLAARFAHASRELPSIAGIVLTGGLRPDPELLHPIDAGSAPAVVATEHDTYETTALAAAIEGRIGVTRRARSRRRSPCSSSTSTAPPCSTGSR